MQRGLGRQGQRGRGRGRPGRGRGGGRGQSSQAPQYLGTAAEDVLINVHQVLLHRLGDCDVVCLDGGALHWNEEHRGRGSTAANPRFHMCCSEGKVQLQH